LGRARPKRTGSQSAKSSSARVAPKESEDRHAETMRRRAGEFLEKVRNVFFTHVGFLILMPGIFNPRVGETHGHAWSW